MPPSRLPWMKVLSHSIFATALYSEVGRGDRRAVEALGWRGQCKPALLKAIEPRRCIERPVDVLFDQHDRRAFGRNFPEAIVDVADDDRRQPERQLIA